MFQILLNILVSSYLERFLNSKISLHIRILNITSDKIKSIFMNEYDIGISIIILCIFGIFSSKRNFHYIYVWLFNKVNNILKILIIWNNNIS